MLARKQELFDQFVDNTSLDSAGGMNRDKNFGLKRHHGCTPQHPTRRDEYRRRRGREDTAQIRR